MKNFLSSYSVILIKADKREITPKMYICVVQKNDAEHKINLIWLYPTHVNDVCH